MTLFDSARFVGWLVCWQRGAAGTSEMRLKTRQLRHLTKPGLHGDGRNLWLQVRGPQQRSWSFRYLIAGKARTMGLGHVDDVSLAEARNKANAARRLIKAGTDPP
jgi:hypothetical protein